MAPGQAQIVLVEVFQTNDQRHRFAVARHDDLFRLRVQDARIQRGLFQGDGLHKISSVVLCGGLCRTALMLTNPAFSSTSKNTRYSPTQFPHRLDVFPRRLESRQRLEPLMEPEVTLMRE